MSRTEENPLPESFPPNADEQELHDLEVEGLNLDQAELRHNKSSRKKACVLLGTAILQLPIWGEANYHHFGPIYSRA
jgi:hypothetical protein